MSLDRKLPLAFVSTVGEPRVDARDAAGNHFVLATVLVRDENAAFARAELVKLDVVRAIRSPEAVRVALAAVAHVPFELYAVVLDKREMSTGNGLSFDGSATALLSSLVHRKVFDAFPDLHVVSNRLGGGPFLDGFARWLAENHQNTLFDRPRVSFVSAEEEPLVALADLVALAIARSYEEGDKSPNGAELLSLVRERAILIDEWPVRYRVASGTGALTAGDPSDDDLARYGIARAEEFLAKNETHVDETVRAQVVILKKLLYEIRFGDPHGYLSSQALRDTLESVGAPNGEQWLRSNVIAQLRDAGVLVSSSPQGYKIPVAVADVSDFVAVTDTVVHPMLNRVARAREAVLTVTGGRVDVLAGDKLALLRSAVDAIRTDGKGPR